MIFSSCQQNMFFHVTFEGTVTDYMTNAPLPNADVIFFYELGCATCDHEIGRTKTDSRGHYSIRTSQYNKIISMIVYANDHDHYAGIKGNINHPSGGTSTNDLALGHYPILMLHVKNTSPFNSLDEIDFSFFTTNTGNAMKLVGNAVDTTFQHPYSSDGWMENPVKWKSIKNGIVKSDSLNWPIGSNSVMTYNIYY
jgi:hypothetical protein